MGFQASTGGLGTDLQRIRGGYCTKKSNNTPPQYSMCIISTAIKCFSQVFSFSLL